MNKKISITSAAIIAVVVAILAFYCGTAFSSSKKSGFGQATGFGQGGNFNGGQAGQGGTTGRRGGMMAGGMVFGEILSKDSQGITVKLPNGGSQIVLVSSSTSVGKVATGTITDLTVGENVSVSGSSNSDGSITAQTVQIRPAGLNTRQGGK